MPLIDCCSTCTKTLRRNTFTTHQTLSRNTMSAPSSSSTQSANIPAFIASLLGAGLGMVGVLYLTNNLNPAPPTRVTAASPGSPLHRANLRRKSSSADTSSDPVSADIHGLVWDTILVFDAGCAK